MPKEKFLSIDSASQEDVTAMFNEICKQVIDKTQLQVKKEILDFNDPYEEPTLQNVIDLMNLYDIEYKFFLKASWTDFRVDDKGPAKTISEEKLCDKHKDLIKKERSSITNPDLKDVVSKEPAAKPAFVPIETKKLTVDPDNIPEFKFE